MKANYMKVNLSKPLVKKALEKKKVPAELSPEKKMEDFHILFEDYKRKYNVNFLTPFFFLNFLSLGSINRI